MSQTSRNRVNSRRVRIHQKELRRCCSPIGHNNTKHFLCPIRSQHSLDRLEMVRWESVPRGFSACAWKLSWRLFSRPDWLPLGLRGCVPIYTSRNRHLRMPSTLIINLTVSEFLVGTVAGLSLIIATYNLKSVLVLMQAFSQVIIRVFDIELPISSCFIS